MHRFQSCVAPTVYRVEVSGWDTAQSFFVEKADLEWSCGSQKRLTLRREVRQDAILFVRLFQPVSPDRSDPVPYAVERVGRISGEEWQLQLKHVEPRPSRKNEGVG